MGPHPKESQKGGQAAAQTLAPIGDFKAERGLDPALVQHRIRRPPHRARELLAPARQDFAGPLIVIPGLTRDLIPRFSYLIGYLIDTTGELVPRALPFIGIIEYQSVVLRFRVKPGMTTGGGGVRGRCPVCGKLVFRATARKIIFRSGKGSRRR